MHWIYTTIERLFLCYMSRCSEPLEKSWPRQRACQLWEGLEWFVVSTNVLRASSRALSVSFVSLLSSITVSQFVSLPHLRGTILHCDNNIE